MECVPSETNVEVLTPVSVTVNLFGYRVLAGDQIKMRLLGWVLIQYDVLIMGNVDAERHTHRESVISRLEF